MSQLDLNAQNILLYTIYVRKAAPWTHQLCYRRHLKPCQTSIKPLLRFIDVTNFHLVPFKCCISPQFCSQPVSDLGSWAKGLIDERSYFLFHKVDCKSWTENGWILNFQLHKIIKDNAVTHLGCRGKYDMGFVLNVVNNTIVKEFWKSANFW